MKPIHPLHGLVAAAHSPFFEDGSLNLAAVEKQAAHFLQNNVATIFICGSTGECHSLSLEERRALAARWFEAARGTSLKIVVHVGSNCLADARALAAQAQALGAIAISALAPSYFKPRSLDTLIACCADIANAAPETPFYFYDIPAFTGVSFPMAEFLACAPERIPTLAGLKFTNPDLMAYQFCRRADEGRWDVPFGVDERHVPSAFVRAQTELVGHEVRVGEFEAGQRRNPLWRAGQEFSHRKADSREGRNVVEVKRRFGRGVGDVRAARNQRVEAARLEVAGGQRGDGDCSERLRLRREST